jgi:site-specific DNA-cytosine methylase
MNVLDLFSGIGGFSLGLEAAGMHTAAFCECDSSQAVLRKHWPDTPIHPDIRTIDASSYAGTVELVCGGYPCQPFSVAGKRQAQADERHLWPEMLRVIRSVRPRWVVAENVAGHIELGFDEVAASLEAEGFTVWPFVIPACAVDAHHRRDRVWIIAYALSTLGTNGGPNQRDSNGRPGLQMAAMMWPTPNASNVKGAYQDPQKNLNRTKSGHQVNLQDAVRLWPTPNASDHRDRGNMGNPSIQRRQRLGKQLNLSMVVSPISGQLNPMWVEWLMGYPTGWTALDASGTPLSRRSRKSSAKPS